MYEDSLGEEAAAEVKEPGMDGEDETMETEEFEAWLFEKWVVEELRECEELAAREDFNRSAKSAYACTSVRMMGVMRCEKRSGWSGGVSLKAGALGDMGNGSNVLFAVS